MKTYNVTVWSAFFHVEYVVQVDAHNEAEAVAKAYEQCRKPCDVRKCEEVKA